jgi:hypothetical protein
LPSISNIVWWYVSYPTSSRSLLFAAGTGMRFLRVGRAVSLAGFTPAHFETSGARSPRKIGTNWFMPALVNSRPGESGISDEDGVIVCPWRAKKSRNDWRISAEVIGAWAVRTKLRVGQ